MYIWPYTSLIFTNFSILYPYLLPFPSPTWYDYFSPFVSLLIFFLSFHFPLSSFFLFNSPSSCHGLPLLSTLLFCLHSSIFSFFVLHFSCVVLCKCPPPPVASWYWLSLHSFIRILPFTLLDAALGQWSSRALESEARSGYMSALPIFHF